MEGREASALQRTSARRPWRWVAEAAFVSLSCGLTLFLLRPLGAAVSDHHPLAPPDTSSPRATFRSFFAAGDELARVYLEYKESPSKALQRKLWQASARVSYLLDLSEIPPAERRELGADAYLHLYEVLSRIELPPEEAIPHAAAYAKSEDEKPALWIVPHTEITIGRVEEGVRAGEFLFTPQTVARADEFYDRTRHLPYRRDVLLEDAHQILLATTGWMIPPAWIAAAPAWLKLSIFDELLWKWLALGLLLLLVFGLVVLVYRLMAQKRPKYSLGTYLRRLVVPASVLIFTALVSYLAEYQINVSGLGALVVTIFSAAVYHLAAAWAAWLIALAIAEGIIASPKIPDKGLDAHLLRLAVRVIGIAIAILILFRGGSELGLPVYGLIAGVGIGGLAIALAAQNTLENFIGSLNLYADRPVRVGDFCRYGEDTGTIEEIGVRSTRIRGKDRTVTTIPNAEFSKMKLVNYSRCDCWMLHTTMRLRYETSDEQLRFVLVKLQELLFAHPKISENKVRVRFADFGDFSLDIDIRAYTKTSEREEFFAIREDVLLRMKRIVEEAGTGFAFPSRTVYQAQDDGLDRERTEAAEAEVKTWRESRQLPFPYFSPECVDKVRDTLDYPPNGSPLLNSSEKVREP